MSLNWVMLHDLIPIPLPSEKILLSTSSVSLSLFPHTPGAPLNQTADPTTELKVKRGALHVTNKRIIFISDKANSIGGNGSLQSGNASIIRDGSGNNASGGGSGSGGIIEVQTLSIPYNNLENCRFLQPWFNATYVEALVIPVEGGGLSVPHIVRFSFNSSGGYQVLEVIEQMKERLSTVSSRSAPIEPLPLYTPPRVSEPLLPLPNPPTAVNQSNSMQSMPSREELVAARVAREEEENERRSGNDVARMIGLGMMTEAVLGSVGNSDGPPGYEE